MSAHQASTQHAGAHVHDRVDAHDHGEHGMSGNTYWRWPGVRETALKTSRTVLSVLAEAGLSAEEIKKLDMLEVGCGECGCNVKMHLYSIDARLYLLTSADS